MMKQNNIKKKQNSSITTQIEIGNCFSEGAIWLNREGKILATNHAFLAMGKYSPMINSHLTIFDIDPHLSKFGWQRFWQTFNKRNTFRQKTEWLDRWGQIFPVEVNWRLLKIEQQEICCAVVENLFASHRYRDIWQVGAKREKLAGWEFNISQNFVYLTEEARTLLSFPNSGRQEIPTILRWLITQSGKTAVRKLLRAFKQKYESQAFFQLKVGPYEISGETTIIEGAPVKVSGIIQQNNTQTKNKEKTPTSFLPFFEYFPEMGLWFSEKGHILNANQKTRAVLGYTQEQISQLKIKDLMVDISWSAIQSKLSQTSQVSIRTEMFDHQSRRISVDLDLTAVDVEGKKMVGALIKVLHNIPDARGQSPGQTRTNGPSLDFLIGQSPIFKKMIGRIRQAGPSASTVLITGETGSGKELVAKALHILSSRANGPFIKVNCAALPEHLIEGELFGYEAGAFTGAVKRKKGRFELADNGTILLDEVGELPLHLQAKLLRVLQERSFERLGGSDTITCDVRILAATNRDLFKMVQAGTFREDLYYRVNVVQIKSPPLRKRREDIPELVHHFIKKYSTQSGKHFSHVSQKAMAQISAYNFPGNVRELENMIERAVVLSSGEELELRMSLQREPKMSTGIFLTLNEIQRQHILQAIQRCGGKISGPGGAAHLLGMNNKTLYSKMKRLGIDPKKRNN